MENKIREYEQKIEILEKKVCDLEQRNAGLRQCLLTNVQFSTKLSNITFEMDCLLVKKGAEIRALEKKLEESLIRVPKAPADEMLTDFDIEMNDDAQTAVAVWSEEVLNAKDYMKILEINKSNSKKDSNGYFKCTECDYKTVQRNNYDDHFRQHTDERPFQCKVCDKTFRSVPGCLEHIRGHDDRLKLKCTVCDAKFVKYSNILKHAKEKHNGEGYTRKKRTFQSRKRKLGT